MPARDPHVDDLSALFGLVREVRDGQIRAEEQAKATAKTLEEQAATTATHGEDILAIKLEQARMRGRVDVLLWMVPGGPALVSVIGGIAWWATRG